MKTIKQIFIKIVAFAFAVLLLQSVCGTAYAEESYDPLEVKLPYKHVYTTTDTKVDSLFHYSITAEDGTPLPKGANEKGIFTFKGASGSSTKDGDNFVFDREGNLTFTFDKPGVYVYEITGDLSTDNRKTNAARYHFEQRKFKVSFYIANDPEQSLKCTMLTVKTDGDVKPNEVELDPSYKGPTETQKHTESTHSQTTTSTTSSSAAVKTGDTSRPVVYAVTLMLAVLVMMVCMKTRKKESEHDA